MIIQWIHVSGLIFKNYSADIFMSASSAALEENFSNIQNTPAYIVE